MSSLTISHYRHEYPNKSDHELAEIIANKYQDIVAIVRYKNSPDSKIFTNFGTCESSTQIQEYLSSPYCHDAELILNRIASVHNPKGDALEMTETDILLNFCDNCMEEMADKNSLTLNTGNNFYVCPYCRIFYCERCLPMLPLSKGSHGVALCSTCGEELIRALPGAFFKKQSSLQDTQHLQTPIDNRSSTSPLTSLFQHIKTFFKNL
jgi:hypothetical protein